MRLLVVGLTLGALALCACGTDEESAPAGGPRIPAASPSAVSLSECIAQLRKHAAAPGLEAKERAELRAMIEEIERDP